ncbi:hypothetical protein [Polaromonas sp.]|uniref:hypothetical protein n=1 Tax=Polaromonas sp. TaxID=1869339 RepID=UPI002730D930|nr:hypothetical protein [Polaromonas sp.]MDP1741721.1 hypothetical protein [Polaromonas sp.]
MPMDKCTYGWHAAYHLTLRYQSSRTAGMADKLTINVWSDSLEERSVVRSMLSIIGASADDDWQFTDSPSADLLLLGNASVEPRAAGGNAHVVARFLNAGDPLPGGDALAVQRPLRPMPFMDLLNEAARRLRSLPAVQAFSATIDPSLLDQFQPQLSLAQSLRDVRASGMLRPFALRGANGDVLALINLARAALSSSYDVGALHRHLKTNFVRLEPRTVSEWEQAVLQDTPQSLDVLCWRTGNSLADWNGLVPWLNKNESYRMIGWPDFGSIGTDTVGIKLSALLVKRSLTPLQLSAVSSVSFGQVVSFLNSASLCGLLTVAPPAQATIATRLAPPPERLSMMGRLRRKLGLS